MAATARFYPDPKYTDRTGRAPLMLELRRGRNRTVVQSGLKVAPGHWQEEQQVVAQSHPEALYYNLHLALRRAGLKRLLREINQDEGAFIREGLHLLFSPDGPERVEDHVSRKRKLALRRGSKILWDEMLQLQRYCREYVRLTSPIPDLPQALVKKETKQEPETATETAPAEALPEPVRELPCPTLTEDAPQREEQCQQVQSEVEAHAEPDGCSEEVPTSGVSHDALPVSGNAPRIILPIAEGKATTQLLPATNKTIPPGRGPPIARRS